VQGKLDATMYNRGQARGPHTLGWKSGGGVHEGLVDYYTCDTGKGEPSQRTGWPEKHSRGPFEVQQLVYSPSTASFCNVKDQL
jgi:hypothetical protein